MNDTPVCTRRARTYDPAVKAPREGEQGTVSETRCSEDVCFCFGMELWQPCERLEERERTRSSEIGWWGEGLDDF